MVQKTHDIAEQRVLAVREALGFTDRRTLPPVATSVPTPNDENGIPDAEIVNGKPPESPVVTNGAV